MLLNGHKCLRQNSIKANMTKKLVKMLKYTVHNLVKFAVALLRAGRGLKYVLQ